MKEGYYRRVFSIEMNNGVQLEVESTRFISMAIEQVGAIQYTIKCLNKGVELCVSPHIQLDAVNRDSNWNEPFTAQVNTFHEHHRMYHLSNVLKTGFDICTFNSTRLQLNHQSLSIDGEKISTDNSAGLKYTIQLQQQDKLTLTTFGGYINSTDFPKESLQESAHQVLQEAEQMGFDALLEKQRQEWANIWRHSDIQIEGDIHAQQAIRFNIFHLNQTYTGKDSRLNVGPKGFTGEKYGGVTYWDTEAYCLPFYMGTKNKQVAKNLLRYRYNQLDKAIENATKLGFNSGAALYPMVTANGEECHNEWEITFEEIHRNSAIAFAIKKYIDYTGDYAHMPEMGLEVLIGISRFWAQRATFSTHLNQYVILGVTGPNEYENNVDNNWYTNYSARWCLQYTKQAIVSMAQNDPENHQRICQKVNFLEGELTQWDTIASKMYLPYSDELEIYIQHDGFLNKKLIPASEIPQEQRPINQHWSWDRILRSPYIKQADLLQGFYFFEDHFSLDQHKNHFDFYTQYTVHESSLSPCIHCIQSVRLDYLDQAHAYFLQTARLDLNDYNKEVHEGLHVTSMAGTWMSLVEGFAGVKITNGTLSISPKIHSKWSSYSFHLNYRERLIFIEVRHDHTQVELVEGPPVSIILNGKQQSLTKHSATTVNS